MSFEKLTREQLIQAIYRFENITEEVEFIHRLCGNCGHVSNLFVFCSVCDEMACEKCDAVKMEWSDGNDICEKCNAKK